MQWYSFEVAYPDYSAMLRGGAQTSLEIQEIMRQPAFFVQMNNPNFGVFMSGDRDKFINRFWFTEPAYNTLRVYADANGVKPSGVPPPTGDDGGLRGTSMIIGDTRSWQYVGK